MTTGWGTEILDFHAHFPHPEDDLWGAWGQAYEAKHGKAKLDLLTKRNYAAQVEWWRRYAFPTPHDVTVDEATSRWAAEVDRYRLEGIVFVTGGGNDTLARLCRVHPRFHGFAHHDPFAPDAARELYRAVRELGLRGYKVLAPALAGSIDDPALDPVWSACEELQIPVLIHFGPLSGGGGIAYHRNINPLVLHNVAKGYPTVPFVIPHFGCGYPTELLHLSWACENVSVDTSGNNEWIRWMIPALSLEELFRRFRETIGAHRIVFGTDSSHFPRGFVVKYLEEQLRACRSIGYSDQEIAAVFAGNARRLLHLE